MDFVNQKRAIIIGAGPAGLTAAYELLTRTGIKPIVLEKSDCMGGISRTVNYKGNRIDLGGHRFFSKSGRVMEWWLRMLPLQASEDGPIAIKYHRMERELAPSASGPDPAAADSVILPVLSGKTTELCAEAFPLSRLNSSSASRCLRFRCASSASVLASIHWPLWLM